MSANITAERRLSMFHIGDKAQHRPSRSRSGVLEGKDREVGQGIVRGAIGFVVARGPWAQDR